MNDRRALIIGYGNPGRQDDGLGPAIANTVASWALSNVTTDDPYQLNIEDAAALAEHELVVFVDASVDAPEPYASMYKPEDMKPLPNIKFPYKYDDKQIDKAQWQRIKANYLGKITHIDDCVGRVVEALKKRGNWDNTLVIFISDHGEMMGSHGYMTKGRFYEESAGIPMWVRPPKGTQVAAKETDVPVNLVDVYATVVEMAGGEMTAQRFSNSLLPIVRGEKKYDPQQATFSEIYHRQGLSHMVRKGDYKWFYQEGVERLYNLKKDPYELNNLINDSAHAAKVREMKDTYHDWMMKTQINYAEGYKPMAVRAREQAARGKK